MSMYTFVYTENKFVHRVKVLVDSLPVPERNTDALDAAHHYPCRMVWHNLYRLYPLTRHEQDNGYTRIQIARTACTNAHLHCKGMA